MRPVALVAVMTLLCALAGCVPQTPEIARPVEPPPAFSASGARAAPERWWTAFADPELDRLVGQALRGNFDLAAAWHRLEQAQAVAERESAALFPALDAQGRGEMEGTSGSTDEQLRLGLLADYEADLWGRIRSSVAAERYRARATLDDYRTAALSLSAEVARTWFQLVTARSQRTLLAAQVETNATILELIRARFSRGLVRSVDLLRQRQLLEATREELIAVESRIGILEHLLAVLVGRPPRETVAGAGAQLPGLPPLPETGLPLELVRRRPDVRSAFHRLQAADRELAAAIADRYPRLTLTASLTTTEGRGQNLFEDWLAAVGADLLGPVFDAGRRRAEVERSGALRDERLASWGQATLTALREVEDALVRERKQAERLRSLEIQVRLADRSYQRLRSQYFNGVSDYIEVLTALTEQQRLSRDLLAARRDLLEFRIALYRALGGGFDTPREAGEGFSG